MSYYYDEDDILIWADEREDEDGRLDSQANHDAMVNACADPQGEEEEE